ATLPDLQFARPAAVGPPRRGCRATRKMPFGVARHLAGKIRRSCGMAAACRIHECAVSPPYRPQRAIPAIAGAHRCAWLAHCRRLLVSMRIGLWQCAEKCARLREIDRHECSVYRMTAMDPLSCSHWTVGKLLALRAQESPDWPAYFFAG